MKGHDDVVELLNEVLTAELTAINQYFVDAKMFANWGYERLAARFQKQSIEEMKDAEELIARVLYLEGVPNLQRLGTVRLGESPREKLQLGLDLERDQLPGAAAARITTAQKPRRSSACGRRCQSGSTLTTSSR